jgi:hypothetical protein
MRKPREFLNDAARVREEFGHTEYSREDILPEIEALFDRHNIGHAELRRDAAVQYLDSIERAEDKVPDHPDLFSHEKHLALGGGRRIKRGRVNLEQAARRKRVIDKNKTGQDRSWAAETEWLNDTVDALAGYSPETVREDVLNEDGTSKKKAA